MKATLVRDLPVVSVKGQSRHQSLWGLEDGRSILHSSVADEWTDENMTFPCTRDGKITDWTDIDCLRPHDHDHAAAMRQMGYEVTP
jgi:hypothetical protein